MDDIKDLCNYNLENTDCASCIENIKTGFYKQCTDCNQYICERCLDGKQLINEWFTANLSCDICKSVVCSSCIIFCFKCANWNNETLCLCWDCSIDEKFKQIECSYHTEFYCNLHVGNEDNVSCDECYANRNYDLRHSR